MWRLPKKLCIDIPYHPAIPVLWIYQKEYDISYFKGTCTPTFIAALFAIAKLWKQPRCPNTDELIKKMSSSYTMEFYSATKNEILSLTSKWIELENIILSEVWFRRPKIACSPSYVDYSPKTNSEILLNMSHTVKRE
jgi:hypothetical protein